MSLEYRITPTGESRISGDTGTPTQSERVYSIEAIGGRGTTEEATNAFFSYVPGEDPWGNPIAEGGLEVSERPEHIGLYWEGRARWELPTEETQTATEEITDSQTDQNDPFSYFAFISSFATAGGTRHVDCSLDTARYPISGTAPDFGGLIGFNGESFDGVDVPSPSITFDVTARTPYGMVARISSLLNNVANYIGCVNASNFFGFAPGTVLFNGVTSGSMQSRQTASGGKDYYWEMNYNFSVAPNVVLNCDGVSIPKTGWDYVWHLPNSSGSTQAVYVERVFKWVDFKGLGIGGNY